MNIPVTDKLWQQSKFDENFNEISYIDNNGTSFEYINPITNHLKYYKNKDISISQESLDNIKHIKTNNHREHRFIILFPDLDLHSAFNLFPESLIFKAKINKEILMTYSIQYNTLKINDKVWKKMEYILHPDYSFTQKYLWEMFDKYFPFKNTNKHKFIIH